MFDVCLFITGDHAGRPLPPAGNVTLAGYVDDVRPLMARAWASVGPLRTPVVATSKGAEVDVRHDEHLLIADTPETFAFDGPFDKLMRNLRTRPLYGFHFVSAY